MFPRRFLMSAVAITGLIGVGCTNGDEGSDDGAGGSITTAAGNTTTEPEQDLDEDTTITTITEADQTARTAITAADGTLSDGVWQVGDAGTVEFRVGEGGLELIDVVERDGWVADIDEQERDAIEVDFRRDNLEYEMEIGYGGGILEVEIDLDIDPAEPGSFDIGPAGTAELTVDGSVVRLASFEPAPGWAVVEQDTSDGEVELELRQGPVRWDLDAEIDDGRLEVEIDFEIEGQFG